MIDSYLLGVIGMLVLSVSAMILAWLIKKIFSGAKKVSESAKRVAKSANASVKHVMQSKEKTILGLDDNLLEIAQKEIENGTQHKGLWTKAFAISEGDENKRHANYVRLRAKQLKEEPKSRSNLTERTKPYYESSQSKQAKDTSSPLMNIEFESQCYEIAWKEIESGDVVASIWAKSLATCDGDTDKTKALYIKKRVSEQKTEEMRRIQKEDSQKLKQMIEKSNRTEEKRLQRIKELEKKRQRAEQERMQRIDDWKNRTPAERMSELGIQYDGEFFCYQEYSFKTLHEAINCVKERLIVTCPFCEHINRDYGVCEGCGNLVDQQAVKDSKE